MRSLDIPLSPCVLLNQPTASDIDHSRQTKEQALVICHSTLNCHAASARDELEMGHAD